MSPASTIDRGRVLDDCWNRIGIHGDQSCPKLAVHIHCRNCEVYSAAARSFLDVALPADHVDNWTKQLARPREHGEQPKESVLIFRSGAEWLALPTARCKEVVGHLAIRTLPHRRNSAVRGITNVRGELIVCFSLSAVLGVRAVPDSAPPLLLIVDDDDTSSALQVDEVHGTYRFHSRDLVRLAGLTITGSAASVSATHVGATLRWRDHSVGVLDERALFASLSRYLT